VGTTKELSSNVIVFVDQVRVPFARQRRHADDHRSQRGLNDPARASRANWSYSPVLPAGAMRDRSRVGCSLAVAGRGDVQGQRHVVHGKILLDYHGSGEGTPVRLVIFRVTVLI
jgi:hypothetical protein